MPKPKNQTNARNRFVLWFFVVGTLVPVILLILDLTVSQRFNWPEGHLGTVLILVLAVWPTQIFLLHAEHWQEITLVMLFAAPLNGIWYAIVALVVLLVRGAMNRAGNWLRARDDK